MRTGPAIVKWPTLAICVAWIAAGTWLMFFVPDPEAEARAARAEQMFEQRLRDCRGSFSERYDCKSELIRERDKALFYDWARRLGLVFGPPIGVSALYVAFLRLRYRKAESKRRVRRVERIEKQKEDARRQAIEEGRRRTEEAKQRAEARARGRHVLLVEDDEATAQALARELTRSQVRVVVVPTTEEAVQGFAESDCRLVITNILMEGMSGIEGIKKFREAKPGVKIVAISGAISNMQPETVLAAATKIGADAVFAKPVEPKVLRQAVLKLLKSGNAPAAAAPRAHPQ